MAKTAQAQPVTITRKTVFITQLRPHPRNYRQHPPEQLAKLRASYRRLGQFRSLVAIADKQHPGDYVIVAGHGCVEAWAQEGAVQVEIDELPADTPSEVVDAILVADNLHSEGATDDLETLSHLLQEQQDAGFDLSSLGSDEETLRQMLEMLGESYLGGSGEQEDGEEDALPDVVETRCKPGDIWQLGRHKIACLDSCDAETVKTLFHDAIPHMVWSDPPYGIEIVATNVSVGGGEAYDIPFGGVKNRGDVGGGASHIRKTGMTYMESNKRKGLGTVGGSKPFGSKDVRGTDGASNVVEAGKYAPVIGDSSTATAIASYRLCAEFFPHTVQIWWGANYYSNALPPSKCWIVWDKENTGNFADAELAYCSDDSAVRIFKHMWNGMLKDSEHGQRRIHPTQKPVALAEWAFEKYGKERDVIYDPFLGSGMSVIAAENLDRTVIGCELSPEYIDLIVARWEKHTGNTAQLLERAEVAHV